MKNSILYSIVCLLVFGFGSCRKQDNPNLPAGLARVPQIITTIDASASQAIDLLNLNSFSGKFTVDMYNNDVPPAKVDIVVIKNGDKTNIKTFKAGVTTLPATFSVTNSDLVSLFGTAPLLADSYTFGADITTKDGAFWQAFPPGGNAYGAFLNSFPSKTPGTLNPTTGVITGGNSGISTTATFAAICAFNASDYAGNFKITSDPWADYTASGLTIIPVTVVNSTTLSIISPLNGLPILITVNTGNNTVSVAKQAYGDYKTTTNLALKDPTFTYGLVSVNSSGTNNFVSPCAKSINLGLSYTVSVGGFGTFNLNLVKQ